MTTTTRVQTSAPVATWMRLTVTALAIPQLVAADPPFNAHLSTDAGAGFVATGVVLVLAAAWGERRVVRLSLFGVLAFAVAHLYYHAFNPAPGLTGAENLASLVGLILAAAIPLALLWATRPGRKDAS